MSSHNNAVLSAVSVVLLVGLFGCASTSKSETSDSRNAETKSNVRESVGLRLEDLDFGEDWLLTSSPRGGGVLEDGAPAPSATAAAAPVRRSYWGVVLRTFSHDNHAAAAANMITSAASIDPRLGRSHRHSRGDASMVVYGVYESADDPQAQKDLEWIKGIKVGPRAVFPRAMLSRVTTKRRGAYLPHELLSVRRRYPKVKPLYTLEIGVWGEFDGALTSRQVRASAEARVHALRAQGVEAYVHHDDDKGLSMVTIGLFDRTAIDAQSGILAPEVERLMHTYPAHLVNGEPLEVPINRRRPDLGTRTQAPKLVLVPEL